MGFQISKGKEDKDMGLCIGESQRRGGGDTLNPCEVFRKHPIALCWCMAQVPWVSGETGSSYVA